MFFDWRVGAVVCEADARGFAAADFVEAGAPDFEVDVRRRGDGRDEIVFGEAKARGVADVGDAGGLIEVGDVMRGVAGSVGDFDIAACEAELFAAAEDLQILRRNGEEFAKHGLHGVAIEASGAAQELFGIGHVRRADFVDVDFERRIFADEGAGSASVIEVNVGEEDEIKVAHGEAARSEFRFQIGEATRRAAIDEGELAIAVEQNRADGFGYTEVVKIEDGGCGSDQDHVVLAGCLEIEFTPSRLSESRAGSLYFSTVNAQALNELEANRYRVFGI